MILGNVWVRSLDLDEAFRADVLVAAACPVQKRWVVHEADGTFHGVFVEYCFDTPTIDEARGIVGFRRSGSVG